MLCLVHHFGFIFDLYPLVHVPDPYMGLSVADLSRVFHHNVTN